MSTYIFSSVSNNFNKRTQELHLKLTITALFTSKGKKYDFSTYYNRAQLLPF